MTIRSPIFTPGRTVDSPIARQFVAAGLALLTAVSLPVGQAQFEPTHAPLDPKIARDWTRTNDLPRQLKVTLPVQVTEWPLPKPRTPAPPESPPLNVAATNTVIVPVGTPFAFFDWQLAKLSNVALPQSLLLSSSSPLPLIASVPGITGGRKHVERPRRLRPPAQPDLPSFDGPKEEAIVSVPIPQEVPTESPTRAPPPTLKTLAPAAEMTAMAQAMERAIAGVETNLTNDEEEALIMLLVH